VLTHGRRIDGDASYVGDGESPFDKSKVAFGANYGRLQSVKKKYDPDQVFNRWFPIAPA
jgi:FAD/FMN-containing dehydrogenase